MAAAMDDGGVTVRDRPIHRGYPHPHHLLVGNEAGMKELGRGVVVAPGAEPPAGWEGAPRIRVDDESAAGPLHEAWTQRRPVVVELAVDAGALQRPETDARPPYVLDPGFKFNRERLQFLVWANTYDARPGEPVWWHGVRAARLGADRSAGPADVGPARRHARPGATAGPAARSDTGSAGTWSSTGTPSTPAVLTVGPVRRRRRPTWRRISWPPSAHPGGPARIIAPAGSGKTRVLTERHPPPAGSTGATSRSSSPPWPTT